MGKGNRIRTERADERREKKEAAKKAVKRAQLKHNITLAVAILLVVAMIAAVVIATVVPKIQKNNELKALHNDIAAKTENASLNNAEMTYLFNVGYLNFLNQYGQYASSFGLDSTKDLKSQECQMKQAEDGQTYTWFDYFAEQAQSSAEQILVLYEEAKARGLELSEDEKTEIETNISGIKTYADKEKMSVKDFIESNYGTGVTEDDLRNITTVQALASKAYDELHDELEYTDEDLAKYCEENKSGFYKCDYKSYAFKAEYAEDADDAAKEEARNKAKEKADALAAVADEEAFDAAVKADLESRFTVVPDSEKSDDENADDSDSADDKTITETELKEKVDGTLTTGSAYSDTTDLGKWAFAKDGDTYTRKVGDKTVIASEDKDTYTAYYLLKTVYRDESLTKNVRHILISLDSSDEQNGLPDEEAKAKADELLEKFNAGDKSEDSFAALAKENTMDPGSKQEGGLYENVKSGAMVAQFNDWIYDSARVAGDTGIVKTDYGYHVMYFVGDGVASWYADADQRIRDKDYEEKYNGLKEKYTVTFDDEVIAKVKPLAPND